MSQAWDLRGRVAWVTGAGGGLGLAIASALAEAGAAVALSDRDAEATEAARAGIAAAGGTALALPVDVTDAEALAAASARVRAELGGLDHLVACAGVLQTKPLLELSAEEWRRNVDVNLNGSFLTLQAAAREIGEGGGSIVLLASVAARSGRPLAAHYAAAKTALISLTKSSALALAPAIRVNAVCPGIFLTRMWEEIVAERTRLHGEGAGEAYLDEVRGSVPLGREGQVGELADAVLFLLSDAAGYVTGQALNVDGGLEMD